MRFTNLLVFIVLISAIAHSSLIAAEEESDSLSNPHPAMNANEIGSLPYRTIEELIGLQNGVVEINTSGLTSNGRELHVRGGRDYENGYYLNGTRINDPMTGLYIGSISTYALRRLEFYPGYMPARFGNANSSAISMQTMSGTDEYRGFGEIFSDKSIGSDFGQNYYTAGFSGPIPGTNKGRIFGLVERRQLDDRNPSWVTDKSLPENPNQLPNNWNESWAYHVKLDYDLGDRISIGANLDGSNSQWSEYLHSYLFNIEHTPYHEDDNLLIGGKLQYELEPEKTSFSFSAAYFKSQRFVGDGVYRQDLWAYGRPNFNPRNLSNNLFKSFDDPSTPVIIDTMTVDGQVRSFVVGGDESHVFNNYLKHYSEVVSLRGQLQHQYSENHNTVLGFEYKKNTIRYYQHFDPRLVFLGTQSVGFRDALHYGYDEFSNESDNQGWENETKHPTELSFFVEDKLDFGWIKFRGGGRLDIFDYNTLALINPALPLDPDSLQFDSDFTNDTLIQTLDLQDLASVDKFIKISPRASAIINIDADLQLRFDYVRYYQLPPFQFLFTDYEFMEYKINTGGYRVELGNARLEPERNSLYELTLNYNATKTLRIYLSGYRKKALSGAQITFVPSLPTSFATYRNSDLGDMYGFDLDIIADPGNSTRMKFSYAYYSSEGIISQPSMGSIEIWSSGIAEEATPSLAYHQIHKFVGIFELDYREKKGKAYQRPHILDGLLFSLIAKVGSGLPYTPIQISNEANLAFSSAPIAIDLRNSERTDWTATIDFRLEKTIQKGNFQITPYISANNLLNRGNVAGVWRGTGEPNTTGWLTTPEGETFVQANSTPDRTGLTGEEKYQIKQQLPINYWNPRQYYFGLRVSF